MRIRIYFSTHREKGYDLKVHKTSKGWKRALKPASFWEEIYYFLIEHGFSGISKDDYGTITKEATVDGMCFYFTKHFADLDASQLSIKMPTLPQGGINVQCEYVAESEEEYLDVFSEITPRYQAIVVPQSFINDTRISEHYFIGARKVSGRAYTALLDAKRCDDNSTIILGVPKLTYTAFASNIDFMVSKAENALIKEVKIVLER